MDEAVLDHHHDYSHCTSSCFQIQLHFRPIKIHSKKVISCIISTLDSSSSVSDQQSVALSPFLDNCGIKAML